MFVPKGPIENDSVLVWVMAWCRTGDKPLSEPMLAQFADAYMLYQAEMMGDKEPMTLTHIMCYWPIAREIHWQLGICFLLYHFDTDLAVTCYPWRVANTALLA